MLKYIHQKHRLQGDPGDVYRRKILKRLDRLGVVSEVTITVITVVLLIFGVYRVVTQLDRTMNQLNNYIIDNTGDVQN